MKRLTVAMIRECERQLKAVENPQLFPPITVEMIRTAVKQITGSEEPKWANTDAPMGTITHDGDLEWSKQS